MVKGSVVRIGAFSSRTGVSIRMLRYYEQQGVLAPGRTRAGYRDYTVEDEKALAGVLMLNEAGLPVAVIRSLLGCVQPKANFAVPLCGALRAKLKEQVERIDRRIAALNGSRALLADLLRRP
jgi:DNA-binding transcriptional MerR regulator